MKSSSKDSKGTPAFRDGKQLSFSIESSWNNKKIIQNDRTTQTESSLLQYEEMEVQTGRELVYREYETEDSGTLLEQLQQITSIPKSLQTKERLDSFITQGLVSVDYEVQRDPTTVLDSYAYVEVTLNHLSIGIQTDDHLNHASNQAIIQPTIEESKENNNIDMKLERFLQRIVPKMEKEILFNKSSKAFDNFYLTNNNNSDNNRIEDISYWKSFIVDLEKQKVIFNDWTNATYCKGKIIKCNLTRTKERIYDIDYDDGSHLAGVKEDYIRILVDDSSTSSSNSNNNKLKKVINQFRLQEGVRIHAKITTKMGQVKYYPSRIIKCNRLNNNTLTSLDIEYDTGKIYPGLTLDDIVIGIEEGQLIEALKPNKITLHAIDLTWNNSGNSIAVCYGRQDMTGWCNLPGAICIWNIYQPLIGVDTPHVILDHAVCLLCLKYHPSNPSILIGGSYNGEIIVWDLNHPESPIAISPITDYSHKEPITDLNWIYDNSTSTWLIVSISCDGRVLLWDYQSNQLQFPIKGFLLSTGKGSKRKYPPVHGGSAMALFSDSNKNRSNYQRLWTVIGQEGGNILRIPTNRFFETSYLTKDSYKSIPSYEDLFNPIKRSLDTFQHDSHIGVVNSLHFSPFYRNLFLSGGSDGLVKLYHMLDKHPLLQWEPTPPIGTIGIKSAFAAINDVKFSPIRPSVFACGSNDGFLYIYDLSISQSLPVCTLDTSIASTTGTADDPSATTAATATTASGRGGNKGASTGTGSNYKRSGITSISFNHKQRDLLAVCDYTGKVHIWKLSWKLTNRNEKEVIIMEKLANVQVEK